MGYNTPARPLSGILYTALQPETLCIIREAHRHKGLYPGPINPQSPMKDSCLNNRLVWLLNNALFET